MTEIIIMSADQVIEERVVPPPLEEIPKSGVAEGVKVNSENPLRTRLIALQSTLAEGMKAKDPGVIKKLEQDIQQFLEDPQAAEVAEELLRERLEKKVQTPQSDEQNATVSPVTHQHEEEKLTETDEQILGSGEIKVADVISSLETYKSALEEVRNSGMSIDNAAQPEDGTSEDTSMPKEAVSDDKKQEIIQRVLQEVRKDPMVATLINIIPAEPAVLGSFINMLNIFKANRQPTAEGQEPTISTTQFFMLSFIFG